MATRENSNDHANITKWAWCVGLAASRSRRDGRENCHPRPFEVGVIRRLILLFPFLFTQRIAMKLAMIGFGQAGGK
ncbi:MAG: hypothetical protein ABEI52_09010, partial [Halobacteriaceae archaeon]